MWPSYAHRGQTRWQLEHCLGNNHTYNITIKQTIEKTQTNELKQSIQGARLTQNKYLSQARTNYKFSSKQTLATVANLVYAQNLDSSTVVTCFNHNWACRHPTKVILDFLESLESFPHVCYSYQKLDHRLAWPNMLMFQFCTNMDRKLTRTSKMHNWSSVMTGLQYSRRRPVSG
jgi:hypothetical protein